MADNLKHSSVGPELTQDEFESGTLHTIGGVPAGIVIDNKVDKVSGKGLSTEDYTTAEKEKLEAIEESSVSLVTVKADTDVADAIDKKHSNALDHTQGTDQGLDTGGLNAVTAAEVKSAVTNSHAPGSDNQTIPDRLSDLSDDSTHRLVTDTEKSTWNGKTDLSTVKADTDIASAISLKHIQGTDQGLDTGGANAVTAAEAKAGYAHSGTAHAPSDAVSLSTVKADSDIADAISKKHDAVTVSAPISLSGQALSLVNDAAAAITEIDTGALANSDTVIPTSKAVTTAIAGVGGSSQQLSHGRLTLESGVPVSTTDQTAKTILYYTPYVGNIVSLYSGTAWEDKTFTEIHIDLTETQSCTTVNGDATLTVADTSQLIVGMEVSGTGIAGGATIASITDATHLEMSANATADATNNIVFKIPASKVVDVFAYNASGSAKLAFGPLWTNVTTRATALTTKDGVPVLSGAYSISGTSYTEGKLRWIGTIGTTATAGQTEDSETGRYVWNKYNKVLKSLRSYNSDSSWTLSGTVAYREYQSGTNQLRAKFILGEYQNFLLVMQALYQGVDAGQAAVSGIALDNTSTPLGLGARLAVSGTASGSFSFLYLGPALYSGIISSGYHYITQLENNSSGDTTHLPSGGVFDHIHTLWEG